MDIISAKASDKATMAGISYVKRYADKGDIFVKAFPKDNKLKLLYQNQKKLIRDYKLVTDEVGERLDKIIINRYIKQSPYNIKTDRTKVIISRQSLKEDIYDQLLKENVALIDSAGRYWEFDTYAKLVARTRTREFTTAALEAQMKNNGFELYQVSSHPGGKDDEGCALIDGRVFRYTWAKSTVALKYPIAKRKPPIHPNCRHVTAPYIPEMEM